MRIVCLFYTLLVGLSLTAQPLSRWEQAENASADSLTKRLEGKIIFPTWVKNTHHFYYSVKRNGEHMHYLVNATNGQKRLMIADAHAFASRYEAMTGESLDARNIQLHGHRFRNNDFDKFYLKRKGKWLVWDTQANTLEEAAPEPEGSEPSPTRSKSHTADSLYTMLGSGYDLYVRNNRTGHVQRLTHDGKEDASYTQRNSADTLVDNAKGFWINHHYLLMLQDMSQVQEMGLIQSLGKKRPTLKTFKMPMPGDVGVKQTRIFWHDADTDRSHLLPIEKYPDQVVELLPFRSPQALFFTRRSRKADRIDLCRINLTMGTVDCILSEDCSPHLNLSLFNCRIVDGGNRIIWWSERTGRGHYYLYDGNGKLLNRITQGETLVAGNIVRLDSLRKEMIFAAYGGQPDIDPYYTLYYKVGLDGRRQTLLTPENGNHELTLSDDGRYAIDRYSRMDLPPVVKVLRMDRPTKAVEVDRTSQADVEAAGWRAPTLLKLKAADGETDLYGLMYTPSHLDSTQRYPIISNVYPGPQDDQIPRSFTLDDNGNQSLAELGFIVINVAPRGSSPLRGRAFHTFGYGNLRDYPLADDKHSIEQLAQRYSFIDLERVGIYGHSGGAFQTVAAMLTYPEFYKVGTAASGNHDNNIYIQWWGETFHGLQEIRDEQTGQTKFVSQIPTNMELAHRLQGRLLLMTGDVDKNVPPSSTYRLADALIKAGKRFDFFLLPGKDHSVMSPYYQNLVRYYFVEHLQAPTSRHIDIIHHQ